MSGQQVNGYYRGPVHVGVDLGTAYTVLDNNYRPSRARTRLFSR